MNVFTNNDKLKDYLNQEAPSSIKLVEDYSEAEVFIGGRFKHGDVHSKLKAVVIPFTGHNGIELSVLKDNNIMLFNTTAHSHFVSEKALQLMLALLGNTVSYHNNLKGGDWSGRNLPNRKRWVSLWNKHVGIFGYGRIGRTLKTLLDAFNCTVHVIDRGKNYEGCVLEKSLPALVKNTDITVMAAPLNSETKNALNGPVLDLLKGKYLINVGRGQVIDEKTLYERLENGLIEGFASDVWYQYPKKDESLAPSKYPIHTFDNVLLSPHTGGFTTEADSYMQNAILNTLLSIEKDETSSKLDLTRLK